jgi:hypothetical protein
VHNEVTIFESQIRNNSLAMYDADWLKKFDFTVPPPNMTTSVPSTPVQTTFPQTPHIQTTFQPSFESQPQFANQPEIANQPEVDQPEISPDSGFSRCYVSGCNCCEQGKNFGSALNQEKF